MSPFFFIPDGLILEAFPHRWLLDRIVDFGWSSDGALFVVILRLKYRFVCTQAYDFSVAQKVETTP
jgi:hypothetical protein